MELIKQINQDYKEALKGQKTEEKNTLRLIRNAVEQKKIKKGKDNELKKVDVIELLKKQAQQREDSIKQYEEVGREELAEKEKKELKLIKKYLPEPLSEEEIKKKVAEVIDELGASGLEELGKVMGKVMPQLQGRADGERVKEIAKEKLS